LLVDLIEFPTFLPQLGVQLDITDQFAWLTYNTPGFLGTTDGNGRATPTVTMPNNPALTDCVFSFQAVAGSGPYRVSNLTRVTPQASGTFAASLESPPLPILGGGAVSDADGELLFIGGTGPVAQRYASRTEQWSLGGATFGVGLLSQTTPLDDGRVLFTGGLDLAGGQPTAAAAIYDPATGTTTNLTMNQARAGHGASQLGNGLVLIPGGLESFDLADPLSLFGSILNSTELFDPATGTFSPGPNMLEARALHTSTTLSNGQALVAGGLSVLPIVNLPTVSSTAYLFNPASGNFGFPSLFSGGRLLHSAVALDNGKVLLCGGLSVDLTVFLQTGNIADIVIGTREDCVVYTPGFFGSFQTVPGMQVGRAGAALAPLPNGGALIAGGFQLSIDVQNGGFVAAATETADLFSQGPNAIAPTGSMSAPRLFPLAVDLPDGTVMVVGGGPLESEIYQR
ncbi:MAG: hypothetical protein KAI24_21220, partial [Planctomycetes bacterium]|nr:hypothetical protein [Planctomycetota bacterium]